MPLPGKPLQAVSFAAQKNAPPVADEPDICLKIREKVTPISKNTEPNEHYESVNKSIMECVRNGGDVIMNSRRNKEFPSKHYCKPYIAEGKANTDGAHLPGRNKDQWRHSTAKRSKYLGRHAGWKTTSGVARPTACFITVGPSEWRVIPLDPA